MFLGRPFSLAEFMNFKLFGKPVLVVSLKLVFSGVIHSTSDLDFLGVIHSARSRVWIRSMRPNRPARFLGEEMARFEELRSAHAAAWRPLAKRPGNGLWAVACVAPREAVPPAGSSSGRQVGLDWRELDLHWKPWLL